MAMLKTGTFVQLMQDTRFDTASTTDQEFRPRDVNNMKMGVLRSAVPSNGTSGYGVGCVCVDTTNGKIYVNEGSSSSCQFKLSSGIDFSTTGIKADVIAESTAAAGVTVDSVLAKDGLLYTSAAASAGRANADYRLNALLPRYRLEWVAGQRGKPAINADILDATEATRMIADPDFELLGTNAVSTCSAYNAEGGITLTTTTGSGDQVILAPHLDTSESAWSSVTWGTDQEVIWEARIQTPATITTMTIWAGLKLTDTSVTATDDDQAFFRFQPSVNSGKWQAISSIGGTDDAADSGVTVTASTDYHLAVAIDSDRLASFYIDGVLVKTSDALTDAVDLIPYIGVQTDTTAARKLVIRSQAIERAFA